MNNLRSNSLRSIRQNARPDALPNFRNLGIILRILLISNSLAIMQAVLQASAWTEVAQHLIQIVTLLTPVLLSSLLLLWLAQPWLSRMPYGQGTLAVVAVVTLVTLSIYEFGGEIYVSSHELQG